MPISYVNARAGCRMGMAMLDDGYSSAIVKQQMMVRWGATSTEANRMVARCYDMRAIQIAIRAGGFAGLVNPRHPLLPSNPDASHPQSVRIAMRILREHPTLDDKYFVLVADAVVPTNFFNYDANIQAQINVMKLRYPLAVYSVVDSCMAIY